MGKYTLNSDYYSTFIGMDVHARSISVKVKDKSSKDGKPKSKRFGNSPSAEEIACWIQTNFEGPWYAAYESGCTGFNLCRELRALGIDCDVIAVSSIARSQDETQRKTDSIDASRMLSEITSENPTCSVVWTPPEEIEAMRDLVRARHDANKAAKAAKEQVSAMLLRHGHVWDHLTIRGNLKTTWTQEYMEWLRSITFDDKPAQQAFDFYVRTARENIERVKSLDRLIQEASTQDPWKPYVDALSQLMSINWLSAMTLTAEIGCFSRFHGGRDISKWMGAIPKEHSSGEKRTRGSITKAGNAFCRTILVEGLASISHHSRTAKPLKEDQEVSGDVLAECYKANERLYKRYDRLAKNRKHINTIKVALANELIRWVWHIGLLVEEEQEALTAL